MTYIYELSPILDVPEYEGFSWEDDLVSVRGQPEATMDFDPDRAPPGEQEKAPRLSSLWKPTRVNSDDPPHNVRPWNDYPCIGLEIPALSQRAAGTLRDLLEPNGELLPLVSDVGEYYAFNVTTVADVLDEGRSVIDWGREDHAYVSAIRRYEFFADRLQEFVIFRLPQMMLSYYVSEPFAQRVRDHKLQGFDLAKLWPLPPGADWHQLKVERCKRWARKVREVRRRESRPVSEPPIDPWMDI